MLDAECVPPLRQEYSLMPYTHSALVHQHKSVCYVCKARPWVASCILSSCSFKYRNPNVCLCVSVCVFVCVCGCVCVAVCMKVGNQVADPDLLYKLRLNAQKCTNRRNTRIKRVQERAGCWVCASIGEEIYTHALHSKVHDCINTSPCVMCARHSSRLQLACSNLFI